MPIQLLSRDITERIAAGEVVERPASVVKELAENSIDAGAKLIEVELVSNGLSMIRITDDGSGIQKSEVPIAFKRHATSKISEESDLERITTLGFRGEALSAISAVSRVRMISRTENDEFAAEYRIDGGAELSLTDTGADVGTTIMVNDLFYNTPARMKFLKKDVSEGNSVYAAVLQLALSHPEISFRLIRDGRVTLNTPGNGDLYSVIYAVFPKEIAENLLGVSERSVRVSVSGYIGKIELSRRSRGFQYAFVNGRFVKSATITAAVEQAYKKWKPKERFPVFVLNVDILPEDVDVNVHPAKTQVRFQSEKEVFSAVYRAVQGSLDSSARDICVQSWKTVKSSELSDAGEASVDSGYRDRVFSRGEDYTESEDSLVSFVGLQEDEVSEISVLRSPVSAYGTDINETAQDVVRFSLTKQTETDITVTQEEIGQRIPGDGLRVIGELFETYIVAELTERMVLIDKHAAHERILFEQFNGADPDDIRQILLEPEVVSVSEEEKHILLENAPLLSDTGFVIEEFGMNEVVVREVPFFFAGKRVADAVLELSAQLLRNRAELQTEEAISLLNSVSCHMAIKAGHKTSERELLVLAEQIILGNVPKYCPHGRPICYIIKKGEIEKQFGRA